MTTKYVSSIEIRTSGRCSGDVELELWSRITIQVKASVGGTCLEGNLND